MSSRDFSELCVLFQTLWFLGETLTQGPGVKPNAVWTVLTCRKRLVLPRAALEP